jgi:hypothetical protein
MRQTRYTIAFDGPALRAITTVTGSTNYREVPDFIRSAVMVMTDLLDAAGRKLTIVLRDKATGREWEYSPHEPGRAVPIVEPDGEPAADNVFRPAFGRRHKNEIILGAETLPEDSAAAEDQHEPEVAHVRRRSRKSR